MNSIVQKKLSRRQALQSLGILGAGAALNVGFGSVALAQKTLMLMSSTLRSISSISRQSFICKPRSDVA